MMPCMHIKLILIMIKTIKFHDLHRKSKLYMRFWEVFMDLYPEDFKEQLDEALEFAKYLKERGLWEDNMRIYKDENGNLIAE